MLFKTRERYQVKILSNNPCHNLNFFYSILSKTHSNIPFTLDEPAHFITQTGHNPHHRQTNWDIIYIMCILWTMKQNHNH